jgi:phage terminase large subunit
VNLNISRKVFNEKHYKYLFDDRPMQIHYGGASSGKSVFLAYRCVLDVTQGRNYLVVRNVANTIRSSVFSEIVKAISFFKLNGVFTINRSDMVITCNTSGCQVMFRGLDDVEKLKSITVQFGSLTDVWVEEATEISQNNFNQLILRMRGDTKLQKRITLSFNPIYRTHWICKRFFESGGIKTLDKDKILIEHYTHDDNKFLSASDHESIESLKNTDNYYYQVYGLGEWGVLGSLIFTNWAVEDLSKMRQNFDNIRHGLDFGFASDPMAYIKLHTNGDTIYVFDEVYATGLTNKDIARVIADKCDEEIVWCDCAEPKSIAELRQCDHRINARAVKKGKDSVLHGIQWLQTKKIVIDQKCQNLINEISIYSWQEDKHGEVLSPPKPIDRNNHLIDAMRYALERDRTYGKPFIYFPWMDEGEVEEKLEFEGIMI